MWLTQHRQACGGAPLARILLVLLLRGGSAQAELPVSSLAPWYCPPLGPAARACVQQFRYGLAKPFMEETVIPNTVSVLTTVLQEPNLSRRFYVPIRAMMALVEAVRLLVCSVRFQGCFDLDTLSRFRWELCSIAATEQERLLPFMEWRGTLCHGLFERADPKAALNAVAEPLHGLVSAASPYMAPPALGNENSRFDYEFFFEARSKVLMRRQNWRAAPARRLTYPATFSPGGACHQRPQPREAGDAGDDIDAVDVGAILERISRTTPLSRFVVNIGAADGECGGRDDWNADPANCLIRDGAAAVIIEGDQKFHDALHHHYGRRSNVSMILQYVAVDSVAALLQSAMEENPAATASADLLKIDVDHADCLFMQEALRAVRPKLIHVEFMPVVPPPLDYVQHYQPQMLDVRLDERMQPLLVHDGGPSSWSLGLELPGCSASAILSRAPDYVLVAASSDDLLLMRRSLHSALGMGQPPSVQEMWKRAVLCHPLRGHVQGMYAWGFDFRALAEPTASEELRLAMLRELLEEHGASRFSLGISHERGTS